MGFRDRIAKMFGRGTVEPVLKESRVLGFLADQFEADSDGDELRALAENGYAAMPNEVWIYACVGAIARAASSVPLRLYRELPQRDGTADREEVHDPRVAKVLERANPEQSFPDFIESTTAFLELTGNAYWEPVSGAGGLDEIYVIPSDRIKPVPDPKKRVAAWKFVKKTGREVLLPRDTLVQLRYWNPSSELLGLPPFAAAVRATARDLYAQTWDERFFKNSARPDAVLETDQRLNEPDVKRLRKMWLAMHQGADKAHLPAVLSDGLKFRVIGATHEGMGFNELRRMNRTEILAAFGVPSVLVGVLDDASYANANAQIEQFWRVTMLPKLRKIEAAFNQFVAPRLLGSLGLYELDEPGSYFFEFDISEVHALKENEDAKSTRLLEQLNAGTLTPNEFRQEFNRPPWPASVGDVRVTSTSTILDPVTPEAQATTSPTGQVPDATGQTPAVPDPSAPVGDAQPVTPNGGGVPAIAGVAARKSVGEVRLRYSPQRRDRVAKAFSRDVVRASRPLADRVAAFFDTLAQKEAGRLANVRKQMNGSWQPVYKIDVTDFADLLDILFKFGLRHFGDAAKKAAKELGEEWVLRPDAEEAFLKIKELRIAGIAKETEDRVRAVLLAAQGESPRPSAGELARRIRESSAFSASRAERIARTETVQSMNAGLMDGYDLAGVEEIEWLTIRDGRERDSHASVDGEVVKLGDKFSNGLHFPGDSSGAPEEIINCRCTTAPVVRSRKVRGAGWANADTVRRSAILKSVHAQVNDDATVPPGREIH